MTNTANPRPILHVHVIDDLTGEELADVDAASTAEGLAYYLTSRGLDADATEARFTRWYAGLEPNAPVPDAPVLWEQRNPITQGVERAIFAHVEDDPAYATECPACKR